MVIKISSFFLVISDSSVFKNAIWCIPIYFPIRVKRTFDCSLKLKPGDTHFGFREYIQSFRKKYLDFNRRHIIISPVYLVVFHYLKTFSYKVNIRQI